MNQLKRLKHLRGPVGLRYISPFDCFFPRNYIVPLYIYRIFKNLHAQTIITISHKPVLLQTPMIFEILI